MNERENNILCADESAKLPCCDECGCVDEALYEVDGRLLYERCLVDLGYEHCSKCGKWVQSDDGIVYHDEFLCDDCKESLGLEQCDECGEWFDPCDMTTVNGGWRYSDLNLCESCLESAEESGDVFQCYDCEEYYRSRAYDSYTDVYGHTICECCRNDHYCYCESCDELYPEDECEWDEDNDCWYCHNCYSERRHGRRINGYSYKPEAVFHGIGKYGRPTFGDPLTFGFELEVDKGDDRNECAGDLDAAFGSDVLYMKDDGSVDFEIVTHPHTLRAYLDDFDFDKLCRIPKAYDYQSHSAGTCGFHIHVGRAQLAEDIDSRNLVIARIVLLMYRHWSALVKFSRRNEGQLNRWAKAPNLDFRGRTFAQECDLYRYIKDGYMQNHDRYLALNLQNRGTIEFRLWRGSLQPETLKATIQLTSNICRYAMDHTLTDVCKSTFDDIVNYETCPELLSYISRHSANDTATKDIPLRGSTDGQDMSTDCGFKVGDRVRILRSNLLVSASMVGAFGTVKYSRWVRELSTWHIAIQVDEPNSYTHDCDGLLPHHDGYWVNPGCIARIVTSVDDAREGDLLDLTGTDFRHWLDSTDLSEVEDFARVVSINYDDNMFGLDIPGYKHGGNLNGSIPGPEYGNSGWYYNASLLRSMMSNRQ